MIDLVDTLRDPRSSVRFRGVMDAGSRADAADLAVLVAQCAVEPDFFVRDMLTWALVRLPADLVVPALVAELDRAEPQARSQALHTLSKIGDAAAWPAVSAHVTDPEHGVARAAWRASVILAPEGERDALARVLVGQLGRGDDETQLSLSRSLAALGPEVLEPALATVAARSRRDAVIAHAERTAELLHDPDAGSAAALARARREVALGRTRDASG